MSVVIIINPPPTKPPGEQFTTSDDGAILDAEGNAVARFDNVADAIAYLQHMNPLAGLNLAEAEDDRA
jgi:hypothetical protein